jgi:Flp pilus assembly protein TadB
MMHPGGSWVLIGMLADRPHGRRLTASEQQRLAELERLLAEDPQLTAAARDGSPLHRLRAAFDRRAVAVGLIVAALIVVVLVVLAGVVGGPGGAVATATALVATLAVVAVGRLRLGRPRA